MLKFAVPLFQAMQTKTDRINRVFREGLTGVRVIRAFRQDQFEQDRFEDANVDYTRNAINVNTIMAFALPVMTLIDHDAALLRNHPSFWLAGNVCRHWHRCRYPLVHAPQHSRITTLVDGPSSRR